MHADPPSAQTMATTKSLAIGSTAMVGQVSLIPTLPPLTHCAGTSPTCITGVMNWVHGTYILQPNGSITMTPFGDGYQQIQDPCAAVSNFIEIYNDTELYLHWQIFMDPTDGPKLHMFEFDGTPVAPQFQLSATPNMLPTQSLRNVTPSVQIQQRRALLKRNAGERTWTPNGLVALMASLVTMGAGSLFI